eukprot:3587137-Rhodomonas_salina.2
MRERPSPEGRDEEAREGVREQGRELVLDGRAQELGEAGEKLVHADREVVLRVLDVVEQV